MTAIDAILGLLRDLADHRVGSMLLIWAVGLLCLMALSYVLSLLIIWWKVHVMRYLERVFSVHGYRVFIMSPKVPHSSRLSSYASLGLVGVAGSVVEFDDELYEDALRVMSTESHKMLPLTPFGFVLRANMNRLFDKTWQAFLGGTWYWALALALLSGQSTLLDMVGDSKFLLVVFCLALLVHVLTPIWLAVMMLQLVFLRASFVPSQMQVLLRNYGKIRRGEEGPEYVRANTFVGGIKILYAYIYKGDGIDA